MMTKMNDIAKNAVIGKYFTLAEMCASATATAKGFANNPSADEVECLRLLCANVLDPLREAMGTPIYISSGYRCQALNKAVGGVTNSQHVKGQAADINIRGDTMFGKRVFNYIKGHLPFDQLIWEHTKAGVYWVHVSFNANNNRRQVIDNLTKT